MAQRNPGQMQLKFRDQSSGASKTHQWLDMGLTLHQEELLKWWEYLSYLKLGLANPRTWVLPQNVALSVTRESFRDLGATGMRPTEMQPARASILRWSSFLFHYCWAETFSGVQHKRMGFRTLFHSSVCTVPRTLGLPLQGSPLPLSAFRLQLPPTLTITRPSLSKHRYRGLFASQLGHMWMLGYAGMFCCPAVQLSHSKKQRHWT